MEFIVLIAGFLIAAITAALTKKRSIMEGVSVGAAVIGLAATIIIAHRVAGEGSYTPLSFITVDALSAVIILIVAIVGCLTAIYTVPYLRREHAKSIIGIGRVKQYYALVNLLFVAMFIAATANNPVVAWIFLEGTTLATTFLISYYNRASTVEAAWKYLIINALGLLLAFFGTLLYFTPFTHATGIIDWSTMLHDAGNYSPAIAQIAFVLVLIGYGTKIGLAPMHTWKPDAYSKSPAPIGALFSGALLPVAFMILLKFKMVTDAAVGAAFSQHLLIIFGLLSLVVAALSILTVKNYKRMLAYSSIEHAGMIALGFGFGGLGAFAGLLQMMYHSFVKAALFFVAGNLHMKFHSAHIENIKGAARILPITSIMLFIGLFAATGFPPFGIFFSELSILSAGFGQYAAASVVILIAISVAFIGLFRQVTAMVFSKEDAESDVKRGEGNIWLIIPGFVLLALVLVTAFYVPPFVQTLIHEATKQL